MAENAAEKFSGSGNQGGGDGYGGGQVRSESCLERWALVRPIACCSI